MSSRKLAKSHAGPVARLLVATLLAGTAAVADEPERGVFVLTSTNDPSANEVVVFKLDTVGNTGVISGGHAADARQGRGGRALEFCSSRTISGPWETSARIASAGSCGVTTSISIEGTIGLAANCANPNSIALARDHLFVVGAKCAESHAWPAGSVEGSVVALTDPSAAQIAVGKDWAAVTMTSGSLLQLPLKWDGALSGSSVAVTLPSTANNTPLGAAFWDNVLGFTPAHSPDSFAIVNKNRDLFPITGPTPPYPTNAPCWVAKGPGNLWYTANSPGHAISIFLTDGQGGVFYKSIPLPGAPTDITVSPDKKWLAVIYSAGGSAYVAVFAIDAYGDLTPAATSSPIGVAGFSGVAISE